MFANLGTVGIPCAVAVKQVLNGTLSEKGILAPMSSKINDPLIKELKVRNCCGILHGNDSANFGLLAGEVRH